MPIASVGIIGAGTMGSGIAQVSAAAGLGVTLIDVSEPTLKKGLTAVAADLERLAAKGRMTAEANAKTLARIVPTTDDNALRPVDSSSRLQRKTSISR